MQFYNQEYWPFFWLLPAMAVAVWYASRLKKRRLAGFGVHATMTRLSNFSARRGRDRYLLLGLAFVFVLFALLRPQWGEEKKKLTRKGVDVIFLLDTSLSMLAQDVKPSRIAKATTEIKSFVKKLQGDRVGLIPFAGSSFLQSPLTLDYSAFFLFLEAVDVGFIPEPGSALSDALSNAIRSFPKGEKKYRVVVVFSDGEFHGENLESVLKQAGAEGVRVYAVGLGTSEGEPIPLKAEKGKVVGYKKDGSGQVVITHLDDRLLTDMAKRTGGLYFPATGAEQEINLIYQDMQKLGKKEFKEKLMTEKEDHYQLFLAMGTLMLLVSLFVTERQKATLALGVHR